MYQNFEDLDVWKKSFTVAEQVISLLAEQFPHYSRLGDQLLSSAVSVPSNIAEGSERGSNAEFKRFLRIAKGSNSELRTQLMLAKTYLRNRHNTLIDQLISECVRVSKMLYGLIRSLED